jgi:hypothetical protein
MSAEHTRNRALSIIEFAHNHDDGQLYRSIQGGRAGPVIAAELATIAAAAVAELAAARATSFCEALVSLSDPVA